MFREKIQKFKKIRIDGTELNQRNDIRRTGAGSLSLVGDQLVKLSLKHLYTG